MVDIKYGFDESPYAICVHFLANNSCSFLAFQRATCHDLLLNAGLPPLIRAGCHGILAVTIGWRSHRKAWLRQDGQVYQPTADVESDNAQLKELGSVGKMAEGLDDDLRGRQRGYSRGH